MKNLISSGLLVTLIAIANSHAALVAYFPLTDGLDGSNATTADDIIDDATHGITDATVSGSGDPDKWVFDATRDRIVLSTTDLRRWKGGTQDIDLNKGFTWSFWANIASSNTTDAGADVIIGTRSTSGGEWHKLDLVGSSSWQGGMSYDTFADDMWHHYAYVGDTTGLKLYRDGVEIGSDATLPDSLTYNGNFEFGGSSQYDEDTLGLYSDIAVWNERLSESQITALSEGADPTTVVPEPSAALLGAIGILALLRRRR